MTTNQNIIVQVRIRPPLEYELKKTNSQSLKAHNNEIILQNNESYKFNKVFDEKATQEEVFEQNLPLINQFLKGYSCSILGFGQTSSGKTYTLQKSDGLVPRIFNYLFQQLQNQDFQMQLQYLQLYNENLTDLLDTKITNKKPIEIKQDTLSSDVIKIYTTNTTTISVKSYKEAMNVFLNGTINRKTAATALNQTSSRSHAILTILLSCTQNNITTRSKLVICDMCGSERLNKTNHSTVNNERFKEMININQGLLSLANVIRTLSSKEYLSGAKTYVPYRESKLTYLLSDCLGGSSQCVFIACVSPSTYNYNESAQTIHYAARARNIVNHLYREVEKVENTQIDSSLLQQIDEMNKKLMQQTYIIKQLQEQLKQNGLTPSVDTNTIPEITVESLSQQQKQLEQYNDTTLNQQVRDLAESDQVQNSITFTSQTFVLMSSQIKQFNIDIEEGKTKSEIFNKLPWNIQIQFNILAFLYTLYQQLNSEINIQEQKNTVELSDDEIYRIIDDINFYNDIKAERINEIQYLRFDQLLPDDLEELQNQFQSNEILKQKLLEFNNKDTQEFLVLDGIEESLNGDELAYTGDEIKYTEYKDDEIMCESDDSTSIDELNEKLQKLQTQLKQRQASETSELTTENSQTGYQVIQSQKLPGKNQIYQPTNSQ